jgi:PAS domain S-box-containing protein
MVSHLFLLGVVWGSAAVVGASTVLAWRQRPRPGATAFAVAMLAATWWVTTSALGLFTTDAALRVFLAKIEWAGIVAFPVAWLAFALAYTGRDEWLTPTRLAVLSAVPVVTLVLALTNGVGHSLVYADTRFESFGSVSLLYRTFGPWFWIHTAYSLAVLGAGGILVTRVAATGRSLYRGQATALALVVAAPLVGTLVHVTGSSPVAGFDPTPYTFVISGAAGLAALSQFSFLDAVPVTNRVARRSVVENVDAGVLVADRTGHVVDANPRARVLFDADELIGDDVTAWLPADADDAADEELATDNSQPMAGGDGGVEADDGRAILAIDRAGQTRYYEVDETALTDTRGAVTGRIYLVRDVTARRARLQRLNVLNRVLRHNLRNEMNVVFGLADRLEHGGDPTAVAAEVRAKARDLTALSEKAREIDALFDGDREPATLGRVLEIECGRIGDDYPEVTVDVRPPEEAVTVDGVVGAAVCNLVENAAEHNDAADPWVEVAATAGDDTATVTVTDNGPGIPDGERRAIAADAETQLDHASGLGLWIANWGVSTAGGSLDIADREGGGTVVTVTVPRLEAPDADPPGE